MRPFSLRAALLRALALSAAGLAVACSQHTPATPAPPRRPRRRLRTPRSRGGWSPRSPVTGRSATWRSCSASPTATAATVPWARPATTRAWSTSPGRCATPATRWRRRVHRAVVLGPGCAPHRGRSRDRGDGARVLPRHTGRRDQRAAGGGGAGRDVGLRGRGLRERARRRRRTGTAGGVPVRGQVDQRRGGARGRGARGEQRGRAARPGHPRRRHRRPADRRAQQGGRRHARREARRSGDPDARDDDRGAVEPQRDRPDPHGNPTTW